MVAAVVGAVSSPTLATRQVVSRKAISGVSGPDTLFRTFAAVVNVTAHLTSAW